MSTKSRNYGLILLLSIVILIIVGRYAQKPAAIPESSLTLSERRAEQDAGTPAGTLPDTESTIAPEQQEEQRMRECIGSLRAQVQKEKTEYDEGTILIGFKNSIDFNQAKVILSGYRLGIESETATRESYSDNRVVTAIVPEGQEIEKVCLVRGNAGVRYAGLNTLFSLHQ